MKKSGLNNYWLISLFLLKIAAGILYGYFYSQPERIQTSDSWNYFFESSKQTDWLLKDPAAFIKNLFYYSYQTSGNLFSAQHSYWNNLKSNLFIKIEALVNLFTLKNYYANVVCFNFLYFFGPVALYRTFKEKMQSNNIMLIAFIFYIPSFLFWCSGLHKDGFIFMLIALIVFCFDKWMQQKKLSFPLIIIFVLCCLLLFAFRNFVLLLLLPALLIWYLIYSFPKRKRIIILVFYAVALLMFFSASILSKSLNFPEYIVTKQHEFKLLGGNSQLSLPELKPSFQSFIHYFPKAVDIAFFRPHPNEILNRLYWPAIGENLLLYSLLIAAFIKGINQRKNSRNSLNIFFIFCYFFAINILLLSGYTVTVTGAIVRYRSIVLPFLYAPLSNYLYINKKDITILI